MTLDPGHVDPSTLHQFGPKGEVLLHDDDIRRMAEAALMEDRAWHDITTDALVPDDQQGRATLFANEAGVLAGLQIARAVFTAADGTLKWTEHMEEGAHLHPGDRIATVSGPLASILRGERAALNYITHLSGVATAAARVVQVLHGTHCYLRDTRKTIPGLRLLEKYAVHVGGGLNHRLDLAHGILVKDNHWAALHARGVDLRAAIRLLRGAYPNTKIEVEVTSLAEAREALAAGSDELLLDNMSPGEMRNVVALIAGHDPRPALEASGGITLANAREVAETGVDYISMGAITHSAKSLDMSLEVEIG